MIDSTNSSEIEESQKLEMSSRLSEGLRGVR